MCEISLDFAQTRPEKAVFCRKAGKTGLKITHKRKNDAENAPRICFGHAGGKRRPNSDVRRALRHKTKKMASCRPRHPVRYSRTRRTPIPPHRTPSGHVAPQPGLGEQGAGRRPTSMSPAGACSLIEVCLSRRAASYLDEHAPARLAMRVRLPPAPCEPR